MLLMTGCAQKKTISPEGINHSTTGHSGIGGSTIRGNNGSTNGSTVYQNVDPYGNNNGNANGTYGSGTYGNGNYGNGDFNQNGSYSGKAIQNIYFDVDKYAITADKLPIITRNANLLKSDIRKGAKLKIEGHCDASGTDEYNYALGLRRARSAKDALVMKGIPSGSIALVSMGESSPECTSSTSSRCYAKNRRVEFKIVE
jgi:outer membrane protein OmpA-like peptidoglycan-associated protein